MSDSDITSEVQPEPKGNPSSSGFSFSIWPPTQKTRDAVVSRLIDTLSAESILSKRYGVVPRDEATDVARRIEEEAFAVAGVDDGIEILQVYSTEISKRMLETVKSRSAKEETNADVESSEASAAAPEEEAAKPVKVKE